MTAARKAAEVVPGSQPLTLPVNPIAGALEPHSSSYIVVTARRRPVSSRPATELGRADAAAGPAVRPAVVGSAAGRAGWERAGGIPTGAGAEPIVGAGTSGEAMAAIGTAASARLATPTSAARGNRPLMAASLGAPARAGAPGRQLWPLGRPVR